MEQKLSDTLVKAIDRLNPFMQNLQLASRFNKLVEQGGGSANLEDNKEIEITKNGTVEIIPTAGKDGMKKVTANINVPTSGGSGGSWHNIEESSIRAVDELFAGGPDLDALNVVSFAMDTVSKGTIKGCIMTGDGDGGATLSACGMKAVDYWEQPSEPFFNTGFDIGYANLLSWEEIKNKILEAYNNATGEATTLNSFKVYY